MMEAINHRNIYYYECDKEFDNVLRVELSCCSVTQGEADHYNGYII